MTIEDRIQALAVGLARLHASPWRGLVEEVGTGSWIQTLIQSVAGASATLWAGRSSYAKAVQETLYGASGQRSVSQATAEAWAQANLASGTANFFSLAITGAVASELNRGDAHAWLALVTSAGEAWTLHLRCRETGRLAQQFSLGELGCELLLQLADTGQVQPAALTGVQTCRIEVDVCLDHKAHDLTNYLTAIQLVQSGASPLVLLQSQEGRLQSIRYLDLLRGRRLLLHKGSFNPVTRAHLAMLDQVLAQDADYLPILEISLQNADKGSAEALNLAHRLAMLAYVGHPVALTRTPALYQTCELFRVQAQARQVDFVCGEDLYRRVFLARYYQDLPGGIDEGLQRLFAQGSRLWVCGRKTEIELTPEAKALAQSRAGQIQHLALDLPVASSDIRAQISAGETGWQAQVLPGVATYIQQQGLYGGGAVASQASAPGTFLAG